MQINFTAKKKCLSALLVGVSSIAMSSQAVAIERTLKANHMYVMVDEFEIAKVKYQPCKPEQCPDNKDTGPNTGTGDSDVSWPKTIRFTDPQGSYRRGFSGEVYITRTKKDASYTRGGFTATIARKRAADSVSRALRDKLTESDLAYASCAIINASNLDKLGPKKVWVKGWGAIVWAGLTTDSGEGRYWSAEKPLSGTKNGTKEIQCSGNEQWLAD